MKILIVAATKFELPYLLKDIPEDIIESDGDSVHFPGEKRQVDVLITGVGMHQMAFHLGELFATENYDLAINAGVGGSFSKKWKLGDVVSVQSEIVGDMGAEDGDSFLPVRQMNFVDPNVYPYQEGLLINPHLLSQYMALKDLPYVKGVTVNRVSGNERTVATLKKHFSPDVESMEGAAFFYACLFANVPFYQLRGISNYVGERDRSKWDIPLAIKQLNAKLAELLAEFE